VVESEDMMMMKMMMMSVDDAMNASTLFLLLFFSNNKRENYPRDSQKIISHKLNNSSRLSSHAVLTRLLIKIALDMS
jgi:hypothetical protein